MNINDTNRQDNDHSLPPNQQQQQQQQQKKKCRGNRRNQRFRRKCRAQGMKPKKIEKLLQNRNQVNNNNNNNHHHHHQTNNNIRNMPNDHRQLKVTNEVSTIQRNNPLEQMTTMAMIATTSANLNKRKRDISLQELQTNSTIPTSTSSTPILQPSLKKMKNKKKIIQQKKKTMTIPLKKVTNNMINKNYRRPLYLKRSSSTLFQMLNRTLNYTCKKKDEQRYIYVRLNLLDQYYCLQVDLKLWQSYLTIGLEQQRWPDQLFVMAKTDDSELCQPYLINYIEDIKKQLNQYEIELTKQSELCSITKLSSDQIDHCLNEFVDCQRKYLSTKNNNQLAKFKDNIKENELFEIITTYYPTMDQNEFTNRLITIRQKQSEIWEELLQLEMRILCQFLPHNYDYLQNFIAPPIIYSPLNNKQKAIRLRNQHYKIIQEAKRQWLHMFLSTYEIKLQEYDPQYQEAYIQLESLLLNNKSMNGRCLFNQINQYMIYRTNQFKQDISNKMSSFQRNLLQQRQRSSSTKKMIGVSPEPYLDLDFNPFNALEWHHLSLGPSCIRLNQSALRPRKQQEIQIKNEHKDISTKVQNKLVEYHHIQRTQPIFQEYSNELLHYLHQSYYTPLSYQDHLQAKEQAQIVASIRKKIQEHNLIIRLTDKDKNFYIGSASIFEEKIQKYFIDTNAYIELSDNPFNEIQDKVIQLLTHLRSNKSILKWQYEAMMPDKKITELSHLYFNPKTHKDDIPVRPIMNTIHASTTNISKFLDKILRPIFDDKCKETTIIDGAHLIQALQKYVDKGLLKSSTLFCTFDIRNLYTMLPQEEALNILMEFLHVHGYRKVKGINLDTIRKLASIVLKENVFAYGKKIYRQTTGGAMGSSFTLTLANIFMWQWQKKLVHEQETSGEFYGRYIDDIFMTWNKSEKELIKFLDDANTWHPNIKLEYKISQNLPFLDVLLKNNNGILSTSVYHKPSAQPYVVPFISDHPAHVFSNIIQTVLTRAVRYSSTFEAFHHERRSIKLMLLYNGYPSSFIDHHFQKFFSDYISSSSSSSSFLPFITDEKQFFLIRDKIMDQPTFRQSQLAMSAATANLDNDQTDDIEEIELKEPIKKTEQKKPINYGDQLFVHYTHEKRFQSCKRDMHQVYENVFKNTNAMNLKLIVGNRNRRNAKNELIRKRPKPALLKNKPIKKRPRKVKKTSNTNMATHQS